MFIVNGNIYVKTDAGYVKQELHKKQINAQVQVKSTTVYSLEATSSKLTKLPDGYTVLTMEEIIAKFGRSAIDDDATPPEGLPEGEGGGT